MLSIRARLDENERAAEDVTSESVRKESFQMICVAAYREIRVSRETGILTFLSDIFMKFMNKHIPPPTNYPLVICVQ